MKLIGGIRKVNPPGATDLRLNRERNSLWNSTGLSLGMRSRFVARQAYRREGSQTSPRRLKLREATSGKPQPPKKPGAKSVRRSSSTSNKASGTTVVQMHCFLGCLAKSDATTFSRGSSVGL